MGIEVLVPDINLSASDFTAVRRRPGGRGRRAARTVIPFGLSAIRNVGEGLVERIVAEREAGGPFADFYDFCARVDPVVLNKRTVESLIKAGAFDSLGHPRQGLCLVFEQIVDRTLARRREADQGVMSLFGDLGGGGDAVFDDTRVPDPRPGVRQDAAPGLREGDARPVRERPPAQGRRGRPAPPRRRHHRRAAGGGKEGELRWVGGVVTGVVRKYTKRGELMATFILEDLVSSVEVWVFPRTMTDVGPPARRRRRRVRQGPSRPARRAAQAGLHGDQAARAQPRRTEPLHVELPIHALTDERVESLKRLLERAPRARRRCCSTWGPSASGWPRSGASTPPGSAGRAAGAARPGVPALRPGRNLKPGVERNPCSGPPASTWPPRAPPSARAAPDRGPCSGRLWRPDFLSR